MYHKPMNKATKVLSAVVVLLVVGCVALQLARASEVRALRAAAERQRSEAASEVREATNAQINAEIERDIALDSVEDALGLAAAADYWYCGPGRVAPHHYGYNTYTDHLCSVSELEGYHVL